ncbi:MAG TPA: GTP cyclohydrolase II [Acidobacteriaceae bacterium]|jgi:GTP cyclohydrolase II|nr:GTP cyclohydrolase II [Acidobacteriaceae bacterium]
MTSLRHCGNIGGEPRRYAPSGTSGKGAALLLKKTAEVQFPTARATFRLAGFEGRMPDHPAALPPEIGLALTLGDVQRTPPVVRIHSQCLTGDVFHSLRCDCHDQLHLALDTIAREGAGVLIYEYQEGRGIGLTEKLRAYELQDAGLDTVEANLYLGHPVDRRSYRLPVEILKFLGVGALRLMTNNPQKIAAVEEGGIHIRSRLPADVQPTTHSARYMATKRERLGHLFGFPPEPRNEPLGLTEIRGESWPKFL